MIEENPTTNELVEAKIFPADGPLPAVRMLTSPAQVRRAFDELFEASTNEILAFSRPPFPEPPGWVNARVIDAVGRGVKVRALYLADCVEHAGAESYRPEIATYVEAGVDGRVVDELPMKLVVFDRRLALVALAQPDMLAANFAPNLLVDDPGFASAQADAFEYRWPSARPFPSPSPSPSPSDGDGGRSDPFDAD
ncbi:MAG TPA: hypothetical protein VNA57_10955 [Acidimicrobiales bacterium]|nr:hypothetical protein [Acidimicrobiales bacterium]